MKRRTIQTTLLTGLALLVPALLLAADAASEHGDGGGINIIGNFSSTIWAICSFLIVLFILWKALLPPILKALDQRAQEIREGLEAADTARAEATELIKRNQEELEKVRREAHEVIMEGKKEAEKLKEKILHDAGVEAEEMATKAKKEIEFAKNAAIDELHKRSVDLSLDLAGHLIQKSLDADDHQQLIRERVERFRAENN